MSKTIKILVQGEKFQFEETNLSFSFIMDDNKIGIKTDKRIVEGEVIEIPKDSIIRGLKAYQYDKNTKLFIHYFTSNGVPTVIGEINYIEGKAISISKACVQLTKEKMLNLYDESTIENYKIFTEFMQKCNML